MKKIPTVDELQSLFSTYEERMKLIIEREMKKMPEWRQHLIDKTFVYDDGKRVKEKLDLVAAELVEHTGQLTTSQFLRENFLKNDGSPYSESTCDQARDYANTNAKSTKYIPKAH
jgi:hypothetical protein